MPPIPIQIPADFGSDEEIELVAWLAEDGSVVEEGIVVAEVATAKAEVEIESPAAGTIRHSASAGDVLQPGATIGGVEHA
jgi:2-oxoglutarate dehydrogenase E2 component (dihydrolipoamide succinyltransferase)